MATTDTQNRNKLGILCEQVRRHCKEKNLRCFMFSDGERPGNMAVSGYFDESTFNSLVQQLYAWRPEQMKAAIKQLDDFVAREMAPVQDEQPIQEPRDEQRIEE